MTIENQDIEDFANTPKKAVTNEGTVEERSVRELITADRYLAAKQATLPPYGLRVAKFKPPGTVT